MMNGEGNSTSSRKGTQRPPMKQQNSSASSKSAPRSSQRPPAERDPKTCGICFEQFTRRKRVPIGLNCGHTFCTACVRGLAQSGGGGGGDGALLGISAQFSLTCGVCRAVTFGHPNRLQKNVMLLDVLEERGDLVESESEENDDGDRNGRRGNGGGPHQHQSGGENNSANNSLDHFGHPTFLLQLLQGLHEMDQAVENIVSLQGGAHSPQTANFTGELAALRTSLEDKLKHLVREFRFQAHRQQLSALSERINAAYEQALFSRDTTNSNNHGGVAEGTGGGGTQRRPHHDRQRRPSQHHQEQRALAEILHIAGQITINVVNNNGGGGQREQQGAVQQRNDDYSPREVSRIVVTSSSLTPRLPQFPPSHSVIEQRRRQRRREWDNVVVGGISDAEHGQEEGVAVHDISVLSPFGSPGSSLGATSVIMENVSSSHRIPVASSRNPPQQQQQQQPTVSARQIGDVQHHYGDYSDGNQSLYGSEALAAASNVLHSATSVFSTGPRRPQRVPECSAEWAAHFQSEQARIAREEANGSVGQNEDNSGSHRDGLNRGENHRFCSPTTTVTVVDERQQEQQQSPPFSTTTRIGGGRQQPTVQVENTANNVSGSTSASAFSNNNQNQYLRQNNRNLQQRRQNPTEEQRGETENSGERGERPFPSTPSSSTSSFTPTPRLGPQYHSLWTAYYQCRARGDHAEADRLWREILAAADALERRQ